MSDEYTVPFAGTPLVAGCILVAVDRAGGNVWELTKDHGDGRWDACCPFDPHITQTFVVTLGPDEWVGPDLRSVLAYLRLIGIEAK